MKINTPKAKAFGFLAALFLVVSVAVLAPRVGCACGGFLLEDEPHFTEAEASAFVGTEIRTKSSSYMSVLDPAASYRIEPGTVGAVLAVETAPVYGESVTEEYVLVVGYQVRPGRTDERRYNKAEYLTTFK